LELEGEAKPHRGIIDSKGRKPMLEPATDTKPAPSRPELRVFRPDNPYVALGLAVSHLMTKPAFAALRFGEWSRRMASAKASRLHDGRPFKKKARNEASRVEHSADFYFPKNMESEVPKG
jgi:hypothetical protein